MIGGHLFADIAVRPKADRTSLSVVLPCSSLLTSASVEHLPRQCLILTEGVDDQEYYELLQRVRYGKTTDG